MTQSLKDENHINLDNNDKVDEKSKDLDNVANPVNPSNNDK